MVALKYFDASEFTMDGINVSDQMDNDFLIKLDLCRDVSGVAFKITSSYRSPEKNKAVGGSPNSYHLKGRAVDIHCSNGSQRAKIIAAALSVGLSVGIMKNALHLDNRKNQIVFHYYK